MLAVPRFLFSCLCLGFLLTANSSEAEPEKASSASSSTTAQSSSIGNACVSEDCSDMTIGLPQTSARSSSSTEKSSSKIAANQAPNSASSSQTSKPMETPSERHLTPQEEVLMMEIALAEGAYQTSPTNDNADTLMTAYEKAVTRYCLADLATTLEHPGLPDDPQCIEYISKLERLEPKNALAICARQGVDSSACIKAYSLQAVYAFGVIPGASGGAATIESEARDTMDRARKRLESLNQELNNLMKQKKSRPSLELLNSIKGLYNQILFAACPIWMSRRAYVSPEQRAEFLKKKGIASPAAPSGPLGDALSQLHSVLDQGQARSETRSVAGSATSDNAKSLSQPDSRTNFGQREAPTPAPIPDYIRVRLITRQCQDYANAALKLFPAFPPALCNLNGFQSPTCINAQRWEQTQVKQEQQQRRSGRAPDSVSGKRQAPSDGLTSF